jgi:two-component system chemotaxis sensor kinase CheA
MDPDRLQATLRATFLQELEEHVRALTADLLALERAGDEPERRELLQRLFRTVHSVKGSARAASVERIETAAAGMEGMLAALREEPAAAGPTVDLLLEAVDAIEEAGQRLREGRTIEDARLTALGSTMGERTEGTGAPVTVGGSAPAGAVRLSAARLDRLQALEVELRAARRAGEVVTAAIARLQDEVRRGEGKWSGEARALQRLAGGAPAARELLALQRARQGRLAADLDLLRVEATAAGRRVAGAAEPLADELRALRMVPVAEAFAGLERAARDLAQGEAKEVDLVVEGGEVALDRAIVEGLRAPLLHLVRNAVGHGLETTTERMARGKARRGRITISARLRGGELELAVADDGRGLELQAIREQAARSGLREPSDPRALRRLVFLPGFTTAREVTDVSGRGVGLDAVHAAVEALQGAVEVESEPGAGARFLLTLPLTLLALRALLVSAGGETLALPATHLRRLLSIHPHQVRPMGGRDAVQVDGEPVPIAPLAATLGLPPGPPLPRGGSLSLVVVSAGGFQVALAVDRFLAEGELHIRGLGTRVRRLRHLAGSAILPDGALALILNVPALVETALGGGAAVALPRAPAPPRRRRVLLVDDSPTTRTLERSILESAGYQVATAADGEEAWAILEREGADALVADVEMPRLDGFALTERVRASPALSALPVVLVTAREAEADRRRGLAAGASAYLVKSTFDQRSLLDTLEELVG